MLFDRFINICREDLDCMIGMQKVAPEKHLSLKWVTEVKFLFGLGFGLTYLDGKTGVGLKF